MLRLRSDEAMKMHDGDDDKAGARATGVTLEPVVTEAEGEMSDCTQTQPAAGELKRNLAQRHLV